MAPDSKQSIFATQKNDNFFVSKQNNEEIEILEGPPPQYVPDVSGAHMQEQYNS